MNSNDELLVIELVDEATFCVVRELVLTIHDSCQLMTLLSIESAHSGMLIELTKSELEKIQLLLPQLEIASSFLTAFIVKHEADNQLPYQLHTNRELLLMLEGSKPLAVFALEPNDTITARMVRKFDPYIANGRFVSKVVEHFSGEGILQIYFALPNEAWRIDAHELLFKTACFHHWNDGFERMEGSLLGYTNEQNSIYLQQKAQQVKINFYK